MLSTGLHLGPVGNPRDINISCGRTFYIRCGCPLEVYPGCGQHISCGHVLWKAFYILWITTCVLWIYPVENMEVLDILWSTYPVENVAHRINPQDIPNIISCGYILYVSVSFTDESYMIYPNKSYMSHTYDHISVHAYDAHI